MIKVYILLLLLFLLFIFTRSLARFARISSYVELLAVHTHA